MNLKVAGLFGVAVIAFMSSIYWICNLGPATDPSNAVAAFFLVQSHCTVPAAEPAPVAPKLPVRNTPHMATFIQSVSDPSPVILRLVLRGSR